MPARKNQPEEKVSRRIPAKTPEARENQLISAAHDLAEKQIERGTASSQVITHFLKLGSTRERLEQERLAHENELTRVRIASLESEKRMEELYTEAIEAMRSYSGQPPVRQLEEDDGY